MPRRRRRSTRPSSASRDIEGGGLTGFRPFGLRAYRLENPATAGQSIASFRKTHPEYRIANVVRGGEPLGADPSTHAAARATSWRSAARIEHLTDKMGLIGPEVADQRALNIPLDQAEILVTNKEVVGQGARVVPRRGDRRPAAGRQSTSAAACRSRPASRPNCSAWTSSPLSASSPPSTSSPTMWGRIARTKHGDRPADAVGRHDPRLPDRHDRVSGLRRQDRPWQCRRPAAVGRDRVVAGLAAALLRQHAERGAQRAGGSRPRGVRRHRRHQCRRRTAGAAHRCARAEDLHRSASSPARFRRSSSGRSATTSSRSTLPS